MLETEGKVRCRVDPTAIGAVAHKTDVVGCELQAIRYGVRCLKDLIARIDWDSGVNNPRSADPVREHQPPIRPVADRRSSAGGLRSIRRADRHRHSAFTGFTSRKAERRDQFIRLCRSSIVASYLIECGNADAEQHTENGDADH